MKAEIAIEKSIRGKKYYLVLDGNFYVSISKKQYRLLQIFIKWLKLKEEDGIDAFESLEDPIGDAEAEED